MNSINPTIRQDLYSAAEIEEVDRQIQLKAFGVILEICKLEGFDVDTSVESLSPQEQERFYSLFESFEKVVRIAVHDKTF